MSNSISAIGELMVNFNFNFKKLMQELKEQKAISFQDLFAPNLKMANTYEPMDI
jgi:hypothetical protein